MSEPVKMVGVRAASTPWPLLGTAQDPTDDAWGTITYTDMEKGG